MSNVSEEHTNDLMDDSSYQQLKQKTTISILHGQSINSNGAISPANDQGEGDLSAGLNNKKFLRQQNQTMHNVATQGISHGTASDFETDPKLKKKGTDALENVKF